MKEITVQVFDSFEETIKILEKKGFIKIEYFEMKDWYFTSLLPKEVEHCTYAYLLKNSFLVCHIVDDKSQVQLCYKMKELDEQENLINEEKIKVNVTDLNKTLEIFKKANVYNWCAIDTYSYVYKKNDIVFTLQNVKDLGLFIEYEEDDIINLEEKTDVISVMINTLKSLGLTMGDDFYCKKVFLKFKKHTKIKRKKI
jgi:predicted adenylyl cyclase CyaB